MYNIGIGIICVVERYHWAKALKEKLPMAEIICDVNRNGSWWGTREAWKKVSSNHTHFLALEEDVDICSDFYETLLKVVEARPEHVISLFNFRSDKRLNLWAKKMNSSWATFNAGTSGQAVLMPREMVIDFLLWERRMIKPTMKYEDTRLWGYQKYHGLKTWVTIPNLVEHIGEMNSALGFNNKGKVSYDFIGTETSGLSIDWTQGIEKAEAHPFKNDWEGWTKWFVPEFYTGRPLDV